MRLRAAVQCFSRVGWDSVPAALMWEFPKIWGTLFWGPYNKDPTIQGTMLGSPIFGNSHGAEPPRPLGPHPKPSKTVTGVPFEGAGSKCLGLTHSEFRFRAWGFWIHGCLG